MITRMPLSSSELPKHSPWGVPDSGEQYGEGVICVGTPSHGGFILDHERNKKIHSAWRREDRTYEEDGDWAIVAHTYPEMFEEHQINRADQILRNWRPHEYAKVTGKTVPLEESHVLRRERFDEENKDRYVAVAAEGRGDLVKVTATRGGNRSSSDRKTFMVPRGEYKNGELSFVIDQARHPELTD